MDVDKMQIDTLYFSGDWDNDHIVYDFFSDSNYSCEIFDHDNRATLIIRDPWGIDLYIYPNADYYGAKFSPMIVEIPQNTLIFRTVHNDGRSYNPITYSYFRLEDRESNNGVSVGIL